MSRTRFFVGALVGAVAAILLGVPSFFAASYRPSIKPPLFDLYCDTSSYFTGRCDISLPETAALVLVSAFLFGIIFSAFPKSPGGSSSGTSEVLHGRQESVRYNQIDRPESGGLGDTEQLIKHRSIEFKAVQERVGAVASHLEHLKKKSQSSPQEEAEQALLDAKKELSDRSAEVTSIQSRMQRTENSIADRTERIESARARHSRLSEKLEEVRQVAAKKRGREFKEAKLKEESLCLQIRQFEQGIKTQIRYLNDVQGVIQACKDEQVKAEQLVEEAERLVEERTKQLGEVKSEKAKQFELSEKAKQFELSEKAKQLIGDSAGYAKEAEQLVDKLVQDTTIPQPTHQREILATMLRNMRELVEECDRQSKDAQAFVSHLEKLQAEKEPEE